jgi:hypothetical protein
MSHEYQISYLVVGNADAPGLKMADYDSLMKSPFDISLAHE